MYMTQHYKSVCKSFFSSSGDAKLVSSVIWKLLVDTVGISWIKRSLFMQNASIEYLWAIWNVKIIYLLLLLSPGATWTVEASRALSSGYVGLRPTAQRPEQSSELEILY